MFGLGSAELWIIGAYFVPALVARLRKHHQANAIGALNLLLGWTVLGWIAAFVWSLTAVQATPAAQQS